MNTEHSAETTSEVAIQCENLEPPPWIDRYTTFVRSTLHRIDSRSWEISVLLTTDDTMQRLNREYRGINAPTDVLSFSQIEGDEIPDAACRGTISGDIAVSLDSVKRNADTFAVPFEEELRRVSIHGALHLAGHAHSTEAGEDEPMIRLQERLVRDEKEMLF